MLEKGKKEEGLQDVVKDEQTQENVEKQDESSITFDNKIDEIEDFVTKNIKIFSEEDIEEFCRAENIELNDFLFCVLKMRSEGKIDEIEYLYALYKLNLEKYFIESVYNKIFVEEKYS